MKSAENHQHAPIGMPFRLIGILFLVCIAIGVPLSVWSYDSWYAGKIVPGVSLGHYAVGGKSKAYSEDIIREYIENIRSSGALFQYGKKIAKIYPTPIALSADIPTETDALLFDIDVQKTGETLFAIGRTGSFFQQHIDRAMTALYKKQVVPSITINEKQLIEALKNEFSFFHSPAHNAAFALTGDGTLEIMPSSPGIEFDYTEAVKELRQELSDLARPVVSLSQRITQPDISVSDLEKIKNVAETILPRAPLKLQIETKQPPAVDTKKNEWSLSQSIIVTWLVPKRLSDGTIAIELDDDKIREYLKTTIAPDVLIPTKHPRFEIQDGRVTAFELAQKGQMVDADQTIHALRQALLYGVDQPIFVVIKEIPSPYTDTPESQVAITDMLVHSETSFAGSPSNRRKNIARGASLINGLLIAPGDEFSLVKTLGAIDDTNGFLPELVIKGTETKPEFGGGLCQVSTTLFRAVAKAGLQVLERRNHSYRVSYYEPPVGFDATIYSPAPDFKFKNDTKNYILIQSKINKSSMVVELWGTKDGRRVEIDEPTVYNIKKPGETKIIETTELPPGKKKCTERAHNGADAFFERRIFYADGTTKKETYKSHYVVWPAVCLIGVKPDELKNSPTIPNPTDSSPTPLDQAPSLQSTTNNTELPSVKTPEIPSP